MDIKRNGTNIEICVELGSGINDLRPTLRSDVDRKSDTDNYKDENDSDEIDEYIDDGTVAADYEELMIFVKDRVEDGEPQREYDIHLVIGSEKLNGAFSIGCLAGDLVGR